VLRWRLFFGEWMESAMPQVLQGGFDGKGRRFGVVVSRFNESISERLLAGAMDAFLRHGVRDADVLVAWTPGSFEIPLVAKRLADTKRNGKALDAVVCLGAIVRGETPHFDFVASAAATGISKAALETGVPILFGVITADSMEQAADRAGGKSGNKGFQAALAALEMANLVAQL
jgi:6,7-dimethyl-8-ribityllumazine synthase